jgi:hypothetical protein
VEAKSSDHERVVLYVNKRKTGSLTPWNPVAHFWFGTMKSGRLIKDLQLGWRKNVLILIASQPERFPFGALFLYDNTLYWLSSPFSLMLSSSSYFRRQTPNPLVSFPN